MNEHQYDPTGGDGFIRGDWRQVESALLAGLITDEEYERIARETEQGSGGKTYMRCHYCQEKVYFFEYSEDPVHYDLSPLCTHGSVVRWMEAVPQDLIMTVNAVIHRRFKESSNE
jgi:hypothetical protein